MDIKTILKHPLLKSSFIYTLCGAINKAVPFLILPILSYYLLPSDYGIVANFNVLLSILSIFIMAGVDGAITVNFFKLSKADLSKYIFNGLLIIFIAAIIMLASVYLFSETIYSFTKIPFSYQLLAVSLALAAALTAVNLSLWRLEEKPVKYGVYEISNTIVNIAISLILVVVYNMGWVGRVDGMLAAGISFGLFSLFLIHKKGYLNFKFDRLVISGILAFGLPLIPHALSFWMRSGVDRILITKYVNETATGLYATGFQFGLLISFLTLSFNNAFVPYMYKLLNEDDGDKLKRNKRNLVKMVYLGIIGLIVLCILFTFGSRLIVVHFFSDQYRGATVFIFWAMLAQTFQGMYLFFVNYIFFANKTKALALITFVCALLQVALSYVMVRNWGAMGAAYATVIVSFINFLAVAYYSHKVYAMPWFNFKRND